MKTKFISNLKQFLFLALAVFGTLVGYSQPTQNPSIGGSKTPDIDPFNIGDTQGVPRDTGSGLIVLSLGVKTQCIFAYPADTGGGKGTSGQDTGQFDDNDLDPYDIGGGKSSDGGLGGLFGLFDIGGKGGKGTSSDTGQVNDDFDPYDIGGRGSVGTGTGEYLSYEIGGKNTPGDIGPGGFGTNPFDDSDDDTGGRGTEIGDGQFVLNSYEYTPGLGCDINTGGSHSGTGLLAVADTGGRNGHGTSTGGDYDDSDAYDTGGRSSQGTTGEYYELYSLDSQSN